VGINFFSAGACLLLTHIHTEGQGTPAAKQAFVYTTFTFVHEEDPSDAGCEIPAGIFSEWINKVTG